MITTASEKIISSTWCVSRLLLLAYAEKFVLLKLEEHSSYNIAEFNERQLNKCLHFIMLHNLNIQNHLSVLI